MKIGGYPLDRESFKTGRDEEIDRGELNKEKTIKRTSGGDNLSKEERQVFETKVGI